MRKIAIKRFDAAIPALPDGFAGSVETRSYFDGEIDPIRLYAHTLRAGDAMRMDAVAVDRLTYVWRGEVEAGGRRLARGSSLIVEHGGKLAVIGRDDTSILVTFCSSRPLSNQRDGGHVHLLPHDQVLRVGADVSNTSGGLHSDGNCAGCELWLNENTLPGWAEAPTPAEMAKGVHAHPENEIIFVTEGQIRLGRRLYESGTALAISAHTFYGFYPGPEGLSFITFRPSKTAGIRFSSSGGDYVESTFWKNLGPIQYLEPLDIHNQ